MNESSPVLFTMCDCHSEGVAIEVDKDNKEVSLAFFKFGHDSNNLSFRQRINHAWHVIKTGQPYEDMVILNYQKANQIAAFLAEETAG